MISRVQKNGILLMLLAAFFFSLMGLMVKSIKAEIPFYQSMFFRFLFNMILLLPFLLKDVQKFKVKRPGLMFIRCATGFVAGFLYFYSYVHIPLANAFVLQYSSPIFVTVFAVFFLKEVVRPVQVFLILVAFVGAGFMVQPEWGVLDLAHGLCLLSAVFAGLAYTSVKKLIAENSFLTIVFYFSLFSAAMTFIFFYNDFVPMTPFHLLYLLGLGLMATLGQVCLTYAYKFKPASTVAPFVYSAFLYGLIYDYFLWQQTPSVSSWIGASLIICAGIALARLKKVS